MNRTNNFYILIHWLLNLLFTYDMHLLYMVHLYTGFSSLTVFKKKMLYTLHCH
jgi:hypothetical protein